MALNRVSSAQSLKLSSTGASDTSNETERHPSIETRVCLVGATSDNESLKENLKDLNIPYITSKDGSECMDEDDPYCETVFIVEDFDGEIFDKLKLTDLRLLGPPVISSVAETSKPLPYNSRPLFCTCMQGINLCFTNFKTKDHLGHLVTLCHYMGACIKKEMSSKIDFLVTNSLHGPKYRTAVSLGTPVMKEDWVHKCWDARHREKLYKATDDEFVTSCKSKPFEGCTLSFLGFSEHEKKHMEEQACQQGGSICPVGDCSCTHLVVEESTVKSLPFEPEGRLYIVVQEWFWGSIQIEAKASEAMYIFDLVEYPRMLTRSSTTSSLLGTPRWRGSGSGGATLRQRSSAGKSFSRKRSRLREETLAKLAQESEGDQSRPPRKRPSTDTSACLPDSMMDLSGNTTNASLKSPATSDIFKPRRRSKRLRHKQKMERFSSSSSCVNKYSSRRRKSFAHGLEQESKFFSTPPALLDHFKELAQGSPGTLHDFESPLSLITNEVPQTKDVQAISVKTFEQRSGHTESKRFLTQKLSNSSLTANKEANSHKVSTEKVVCKRKRRFSLSATGFQTRILDAAPNTHRRLSLMPESNRLCLNESAVEALDEAVEYEKDSRFVENSFTSITANENDVIPESNNFDKVASPKPAVSARYQVALEFLQTEKNYVGILQTILNLFKKQLDDPNQAGGQILAAEDIKAIFGSLPEIESVHRTMRDDLQAALNSWNDFSCIGKLVQKYAEEFGRCYPSFVNFFEVSVETISRCEARSPRFHAFLKINQAKKECGRQTLAELLINPVQRIPRVILLLQDVKKHTERENASHPDIKEIQSSIDALKEVMTYINEDKRKTESQRHIFDIVYEVEGCPPTIVSSHRQFVGRAEMIAIDDNLCARGDHISLFVFSDCVEIAKRRRGVKGNNFKSPNVHARPASNAKSMKHIKLMSLLHIKKVVNINDSDDCENALSLYCRTPTDTQDWLYTFKVLTCSDEGGKSQNDECSPSSSNKENVPNSDSAKQQLLQLLARHRTNTMCKASDDNFVCVVNSNELDVSTSDLGSTLGRAVRAAKKSSRKLTRAFSFSRTPRRVVQRAMTNMLSPAQNQSSSSLKRSDSNASGDMEVDDPSGQASGLTPSMSVSSLCTPKRDHRRKRLPSSTSLQCVDESAEMQFPPPGLLKNSVSTMTLARPPTAADRSDFPAIPTPPARKRNVGSSIKAATIAFGRTGSFRRRRKYESAV